MAPSAGVRKYSWLQILWTVLLLLSVLEPEQVTACPDTCTCKWKGGKQTVECINKGLAALPEGIDPETQVLDMSGSTLQILHRTLFQRYGLVNLQRVYLSRSRIGHLDDLTFQGLTNLVELDLSDNMLTSVPVAALSELPALMRLSMARNPLRRINADSFRTLRYLTTLELSHCQIDAVEMGAFEGLKALEWLKLDGNSLSSIGGAGVLPRSLHGVTLHDNPWNCDCHLGQLRAWLVQFNIPLSMEPKCSLPERLGSRVIKSLDPMDFACAPKITPHSSVVNFEVLQGDSITLSCQVTGDPEPRISWFHNGHKISAASTAPLFLANETEAAESSFYYSTAGGGSEGQRSELNIVNVTDKENGTYICTAENRAGSVQANFTLFILAAPTLPAPPASIEYVITVGGVVAAIVITLVIIVVAVAVRCCCCNRRRGRRTQDKAANTITATTSSVITSPESKTISPQLPPRPVQMLPLATIKTNGHAAEVMAGREQSSQQQYGVHSSSSLNTTDNGVDQSPDLINDTTAIKWREQQLQQQQAVCPVDGGPYSTSSTSFYGHVIPNSNGNPYYQEAGPLTTISGAVLQQQHYYNPQCQMPYSTSSAYHPASGTILNPGSYLLPIPSNVPLVDSEGFPIDYGLPRPSRPTRPTQSHVRFADPPSVSVRHYENYVLDGETNQLHHEQCYDDDDREQDILPDRKYPDSYEPLPSSTQHAAPGAMEAGQSEIRYPSERYPREYSMYSGGATQMVEEVTVPSPPAAYGQQQKSKEQFIYPPSVMTNKPHSASSSLETSSDNSTVNGGAPSSPFDVSISNDACSSSSPGFTGCSSSTLQRQPHESPDEGYEDEGIDGTEI